MALPAMGSGTSASQVITSGPGLAACSAPRPDAISLTPQSSRKRPADASPTTSLSPSQPTPTYRKIELDANELRAPLRRLPPQAVAEAKVEAVGQALNGTIDALAAAVALLNEHSEKLQMHHEGISHRVLEARRGRVHVDCG